MEVFTVAIFDHFDGTNKLFIISDAETKPEACKKALLQHCPPEYRDDAYMKWVNDMPNTVKGIAIVAVQCDLSFSQCISLTLNTGKFDLTIDEPKL